MKKTITFLLLLFLVKVCQAQCTGTPDEPIIKVKHVGTNYILYAASSTAGLKCSWTKAICSSFLSPATPVIGAISDSIIVSESDPGWAYWLTVYCVSSGLYSTSCAICVPFTKDIAKLPSLVRACPGDTLTINASLYLARFCKQIQWQDSISGLIPGATSKTLKIKAPVTTNAYRIISFWPDDSTTYSDWVSYMPYYCPSYSPFIRPSSGVKGDESLGTTISEEASLTHIYSIYPNPSDGNVNITQKLADATPVEIVIYNLQGKVVLKTSKYFHGNTLTLHFDDIPDGFYLLQLNDSSGQSSRLRFTIHK